MLKGDLSTAAADGREKTNDCMSITELMNSVSYFFMGSALLWSTSCGNALRPINERYDPLITNFEQLHDFRSAQRFLVRGCLTYYTSGILFNVSLNDIEVSFDIILYLITWMTRFIRVQYS